uniref:Photosystem I assembly protein Ycf4 n=1 Tax=Tephrosia onobrychoides TaxID=2981241 RepID=A0A977R6B4_9FABA|nr:photosystem I assembly protein Ycf4 [Tephrosia onobrychoides]UXL85311.1 photosystem I assembly protein Ycf4 [Tephrosia onobrychoides]
MELSDDRMVYFVRGAQRKSNFFWAFLVFVGSLGLFVVGIFNYLGMDFLFFSEELIQIPAIPFIPQGATLAFYGLVGICISSYLLCIVFWDVGGGYDIMDKTANEVSFFRWGFPGLNRDTLIRVPMEEIKSIRLQIAKKEQDLFTGNVGYYIIACIDTEKNGLIPLTRLEDNLYVQQTVDKAAEISRFLGVPLLNS